MGRFIHDAVIGGYIPGDSLLHRLDPRVKLVCLVVALIAVFIGSTVEGLVGNAVAILAVAGLCGVGRRIWLSGLSRFTWMLVLAGGLNLFLSKTGQPILVSGWETPFTWEGLGSSVVFVLDLVEAIILSMALTFTTTPRELTKGCEKLALPLKYMKVPIEELAMVALLALRFVPILQLELRNTIDAQRARGIEFDHGDLIARSRNLIAVLLPALMGSLRRGEALASAMTMRGFEPGRERSEFRPLQISPADYLAAGCMGLFLLVQIFVLR